MWGSSQSVGSGCMCVRGVCVSEENACVYMDADDRRRRWERRFMSVSIIIACSVHVCE